MIELPELATLLSDWYNYGRISATDKNRIKQEAFRVGEADPEGCKTCPNFWNNVMQNMISYVRKNNLSIMSKPGKYILVDGTGSFMVPMTSVQVVAEGTTNEFNKVVGDPANEEFIENLLKKYPELKAVVLPNPALATVTKKPTKAEQAAIDKQAAQEAADLLAAEAAEAEAQKLAEAEAGQGGTNE